MSIDWANRMYGTPTTGYAGETNIKNARVDNPYSTDAELYQNLFQANRQMPLSGSAAGSADFLAGYAQRNVPAQISGMGPVSFNPLLGPEGANDQVVNTNRTFETVRQEAEASYLARATEQRDLARQGILMGGQDRYQQARMALEQQRALSDTRGLTAGAREGAQQTLSATQQVALSQIQAQTQSELLQLQQQGVQDEFLAQEWADRKVQQFQTSSPEAGALRGLQTLYQNAANTGDVDKMNELAPQVVAAELALFGTPQSEIKAIQDAATAGNLPELNWLVKERIRNITGSTGGLNMLLGVGATGGGILVGAGAVTKIVGAVGTAIAGKGILAGAVAIVGGAAAAGPLAVAGTVALAILGTAAIVFGAYRMVVGAQQMFRSPERKRELLNEVLADERVRLNRLGYTNEAIDAAIDETIKNLAPIFQ